MTSRGDEAGNAQRERTIPEVSGDGGGVETRAGIEFGMCVCVSRGGILEADGQDRDDVLQHQNHTSREGGRLLAAGGSASALPCSERPRAPRCGAQREREERDTGHRVP